MNNEIWIALGDELPPDLVWVWARLADGSDWRGYWTGNGFAIGNLPRPNVTHWRHY